MTKLQHLKFLLNHNIEHLPRINNTVLYKCSYSHFCSMYDIFVLFLIQVGSNLKDPEYPIWVVCSESHFTVLFSHQRRLLQDS